MKLSFYLILSSIFFLSGCASTQTTYQETLKTANIRGIPIIQRPVVVDLNIRTNKASGTAETPLQGTTAQIQRTLLSNARQNAMKDAIEKAGADVLIQPTFEISIKNNYATVTATGFPANYKNFRPMEAKDSILLREANLSDKVETNEPVTVEYTKSYLALILSLAGLLTLLIILSSNN